MYTFFNIVHDRHMNSSAFKNDDVADDDNDEIRSNDFYWLRAAFSPDRRS